jgi:hypothetical protein
MLPSTARLPSAYTKDVDSEQIIPTILPHSDFGDPEMLRFGVTACLPTHCWGNNFRNAGL